MGKTREWARELQARTVEGFREAAACLARASEETARRVDPCGRGLEDGLPDTVLTRRARKFRRFSSKLARRADKIAGCGSARRVLVSPCGNMRPIVDDDGNERPPDHCRIRGCPRCDRSRAQKLREAVPAILANRVNPLKFLTVTVANVRELETPEGNAFRLLDGCLRGLRRELAARDLCDRCHRWKRRKAELPGLPICPGEGCDPCSRPTCARRSRPPLSGTWQRHKVAASLRCIEVTYSDENGWHPHAHMLVDMPWTCQGALVELWGAITARDWPGGRSPILDVRLPYGQDGASLAELLKYPTKVAALWDRPERLAEFSLAAHGVRFVQATGAWRAWKAFLRRLEDEAQDEDAGGCNSRRDVNPFAPCEGCGSTEWHFVTVGTTEEERAQG